MSSNWRHRYFEKNINELHTNIFRSLGTEQYLRQILKNNGFDLHKCRLNFSNFAVNVFLSVYKTEHKSFTFRKNARKAKENLVLQNEKLITLKNRIEKYYKQKRSPKNFSNRLKYVKISRSYRNCLLELKSGTSNLSTKILESLNLFTNGKFNINLAVREINFINSSTKQALLSLRKFEKTPFFKEGKSLFIPLITQKDSAKLLGTFIATQLSTIKRHNFFFNFLQESLALIMDQKLSKVQGVKILIKGRLNNAARSRSRLIKVGKISLLEINSKIDYSESTSYTSNGTFGVKVWVCEKN